MKAFHNDIKIKEKYLDRVKQHRLADEIIKGTYWEEGKGCAVGCTIHSGSHFSYETELGIPEWLARLEDTIFEGLPNERAMLWPEEFLSAIPVGADLEKVKAPFMIFILEGNLKNFDNNKFPEVTKATKDIIELYKNNCLDEDAWSAAESAAESAAWSAAWSAARSAARSAAESAAESAAWSAAWSAARSAAGSAAWSAARSAARSAAGSAAWSAWSAESAAEAARSAFAEKLLELLRVLTHQKENE